MASEELTITLGARDSGALSTIKQLNNQLKFLDKEYALEFVKMVNDMETLGATEFIESFYLFATNKFKNLLW